VRVRNDTGVDFTFRVAGREIEWLNNGVVEFTENEWELIHSSTPVGVATNRVFWRGLFPNSLPRLVPLKGRSPEDDTPKDKKKKNKEE
jgi:hypothetical protein